MNILPLPMDLQLISLSTLSELVQEVSEKFDLPEFNEQRGRTTRFFNLQKRKIKKTRFEFAYRDCRKADKNYQEVNFSKSEGLTNRLLELMWKYVGMLIAISLNKTVALGNSVTSAKNAENYGQFFY